MKNTTLIALVGAVTMTASSLVQASGRYEVWAIDQSADSDGDANAGILHVFEGSDAQYIIGKAKKTHQIDLQDAALAAGFDAGIKPHMTLFNTGATHMLVGHASNGVVYAIDADTKEVVDSYDLDDDLTSTSGKSHAATPAPNNEFMVISDTDVADVIVRVETDYAGGTGNIFGDATVIPVSGNSICGIITNDSNYGYVTIASGGLDIVDFRPGSSTENQVIYHYTADPSLKANAGDTITVGEVGANGCGGFQVGDVVYINSGNPNPQHQDMVYAFDNAALPGNKPDIVKIPQNGNDTHGMSAPGNGNYLWACNRGSNTCNVLDVSVSPFDPSADPSDPNRISEVIDLEVGGILGDAAPDLTDTSPSGQLVFIAQRGPTPISANDANFNNAKGDSPGVGVVISIGGGSDGFPIQHYPLDNFVGVGGVNVNVADIHSLRVRK